jgi:hypothetical protein
VKKLFLTASLIVLFATPIVAQDSKPAESNDSKLLYADFQEAQNGRPVSKRGGQTRLNWYSQNSANPPQFSGMENANPPAPALARVTDQDRAAAFNYEMRIPNEFEGVNLEVFGQPEKDGKLVADDVSGYKYITLRLFAKGPRSIRIELITRDHGVNLEAGYPNQTFQVGEGFNTYKLKLDSFNQPQWATQLLDLKRDVLKKLTSITIGVFCDKCRFEKGTVVVDNIAFEK